MKTIELSGIIKMEYDNWYKIKLIQPDGLKIDLTSRVKEIIESFGTTGGICYYISNNPITKDKAVENHLKRLFGVIAADYESDYTYYSALTGGSMDYQTELTIGGHNLYNELQEHEGKYLIIEITIKDNL